ncbi:MAG: hypothetical protein ABI894_10290 [Ilumatobacteraceae bacterium]
MFKPITYEIVIRGRATAGLLRPLLDDFTFDHASVGVTRLVGVIRDSAHLHGVVAHLTSVNAELISISPLTTTQTSTQHEWTSS